MSYQWLNGLAAIILASAMTACVPPQFGNASRNFVNPSSDGGSAARAADYRIGPEDELHVTVWKNETLTRTVPVRPDGMISLPLVNDVNAAGLTPMELRDVLRKKLTAYMTNPEVSVIVQKVASFKVSVMGEVMKPGTYEINGHSTVIDALARAEGLTEFAARSRIVVLRKEGGATQRIPFNYNRAVSGAGDQDNFFLRPGDIVVVP
ncbi:MAG: polysaccharide biosynthesis/export family protein [Deltaproteobacteria bacterium]|nr:polysaccharide biosynthesis/export family protein [Deltaproteobacteria bacterium]